MAQSVIHNYGGEIADIENTVNVLTARSVEISQIVSIPTDGTLDIDVSSYLPANKTAFYAIVALSRYVLPQVNADGTFKTYVDKIFQNVVTIKDIGGGWTNAPMKMVVFYY